MTFWEEAKGGAAFTVGTLLVFFTVLLVASLIVPKNKAAMTGSSPSCGCQG